MTSSTPSNETPKRKPDETDTAWEQRVKRLKRDATLDTLEALGFDVEDAKAMQADMIFLRKLRTTSDAMSSKAILGLVGIAFSALGALVAFAIQGFFKPHA